MSKKYVLIDITNLGGSDMRNILFIEYENNELAINKLINILILLTDNKRQYICDLQKMYLEDEIISFFSNPLYKACGDNGRHYDTFRILQLSGILKMLSSDIGQLSPNDIDKLYQNRVFVKQWENHLECTKYPRWEYICDCVKELYNG